MKIKLLSLSLLSLFFISCGGDDSSSSSQEGFFCNVTKQKGLVKQEFQIPGVFDGSVEVSVKNGEACIVTRKTFFGFSKAEMDEICDELEYDLGEDLDNGKATAECGGNSLYVSQKMSSKSLGSPSDVAAEMQEECDEYEEDWLEYSLRSSSSSKETPSSSSERKSSSSLEEKSSSSSKPSSSSSSSSEEPETSSSEETIVRVIHEDAFDGMSIAPDAFAGDDSTLYFEDFGGKVLCLYDDSVYNTNFLMEEDLPSGKLEFFFRPHEDFFRAPRVLIGNDGARLLVYYDGTNLVLMMNKNNVFRYIKQPAEILTDWNYVLAEWGDGRASLFLNNELVGEMALESGYEASERSWEHEIVIGQKSNCCMSGADMNSQMRTSADFGPIRVSVPKADVEDVQPVEPISEEPSDEEPAVEPVSEDPPSEEPVVEILNE